MHQATLRLCTSLSWNISLTGEYLKATQTCWLCLRLATDRTASYPKVCCFSKQAILSFFAACEVLFAFHGPFWPRSLSPGTAHISSLPAFVTVADSHKAQLGKLMMRAMRCSSKWERRCQEPSCPHSPPPHPHPPHVEGRKDTIANRRVRPWPAYLLWCLSTIVFQCATWTSFLDEFVAALAWQWNLASVQQWNALAQNG